MTIPYSQAVTTSRFRTLFKILFLQWDGSVWQLLSVEMIIWAAFYLAIQTFYHFYSNTYAGDILKAFTDLVRREENSIMLPFLLGFFTMIAVSRWWNIYKLMEWPDSVASSLAVHLRPETTRLENYKVQILRRSIAKYLQLSFVLLIRNFSVPLSNRFPNYESINRAQLLNGQELAMIKILSQKMPQTRCLYWVPFQWLFTNLKKACFVDLKDVPKPDRKRVSSEGSLFDSKYEYLHVVEELINYRTRMGELINFDLNSPTLAFTQTTIFATYGFIFLFAFSRQRFDESLQNAFLDVFMSMFETAIYLAWLKCTLIMINPFGEDRDDFELLWLTDRHWRVIYRILDDPWKLFPKTTFTRSAHHFRKKTPVSIRSLYLPVRNSQELLTCLLKSSISSTSSVRIPVNALKAKSLTLKAKRPTKPKKVLCRNIKQMTI